MRSLVKLYFPVCSPVEFLPKALLQRTPKAAEELVARVQSLDVPSAAGAQFGTALECSLVGGG